MKNILEFIVIGNVIISFIIIWFLTQRKKLYLNNKILIVFFLCIGFSMLHIYSQLNGIKLLFLSTFIIQDTIVLFIAPLLYLYVKSLYLKEKGLIKKNIIHFMFPAIYLLLISIPLLIFKINETTTPSFFKIILEWRLLHYVLENFYLLIYLIFTLNLYYKYKKLMTLAFSDLKDKELRWIKYLLFGMIIIITIDQFAYLYDFVSSNTKIETGFLSIILTFGYFYFLGYYGLKQSKILLPDFLLSSIKENKSSEIIKSIDSTQLKIYLLKITEVLTKEKIYLDDELTLHKFAKEININEKKLSAILNQEMNISFYNLINSYRIEEFKRRILSNEFQHLTIIGIAFDCGFKSKSTFHRLFKQNTGKTPKDYKNSFN